MTDDADSWSFDTEFGEAQSTESEHETEVESERSSAEATAPAGETARTEAAESTDLTDPTGDTESTAQSTHPDRDGPSPTIELDHVTIENGSQANECAIFPADAPEEELMTNWIAAIEGSFVALDSMR
ncbi:hypothetical protein C482_19274 [Natrialba chahannaoensis JCM 10990]|uniref:DUF7511 domain-containing protein n=1 Tax=Natrialba chahannaoensis JCM 10990 TaxID=1227492 RepID=M0A5H1_9EURY|nr:hypothetical protein [Natrialba chahannaoensis]ELY93571.1 hypothetical protein C482_19274 [Natrialba chahannaoensis JCM 10990]